MATLVRKALYRQPFLSCFKSQRLHLYPRSYASEPSRSASSSPTEPVVETFSGPSRQRGKPFVWRYRDLPKQKTKWPYIIAATLIGLGGWAAFMTYVTNEEMIRSSVVQQIMRSVREDSTLREALGDAIRPQPEWWLNGDPKINGRISTLQGNIDVSWRIRGTEGSGTLYFTSIRKEKGHPFTILRFKVICDDGNVVLIDAEPI